MVLEIVPQATVIISSPFLIANILFPDNVILPFADVNDIISVVFAGTTVYPIC
jgi:hypothetical protein